MSFHAGATDLGMHTQAPMYSLCAGHNAQRLNSQKQLYIPESVGSLKNAIHKHSANHTWGLWPSRVALVNSQHVAQRLLLWAVESCQLPQKTAGRCDVAPPMQTVTLQSHERVGVLGPGHPDLAPCMSPAALCMTYVKAHAAIHEMGTVWQIRGQSGCAGAAVLI